MALPLVSRTGSHHIVVVFPVFKQLLQVFKVITLITSLQVIKTQSSYGIFATQQPVITNGIEIPLFQRGNSIPFVITYISRENIAYP